MGICIDFDLTVLGFYNSLISGSFPSGLFKLKSTSYILVVSVSIFERNFSKICFCFYFSSINITTGRFLHWANGLSPSLAVAEYSQYPSELSPNPPS